MVIRKRLKGADKGCFKQSFGITNETRRIESRVSMELIILEKTNNEY